IDWFTPQATQATEDIPPDNAQECHVDQLSTEALMCEWGDPQGEVTVAMVGDSKMFQWWSAVDQIARQQGWKVQQYTKSACGFNDGMQVRDDRPYEECAEWNDNVIAALVDQHPDVVLTSQRHNSALDDATDVGTGSVEAMVAALNRHWVVLSDSEIPVIELLDNPTPRGNVYECVADNLDDLQACTFDREEALQSSGDAAQIASAEQVPGVQTIDMTDQICPEETCVPVIGNVLVYRQGSHITDTYVRTLTPDLADQLVPAVEAAIDDH
ncbi:MAG TPA: SGNH hydrolase domain-containing protein, partial [Beutenbergiaceae bacterium]|nr:SGNH hydrolase domain-containing protein [Beutenbergiaceae bacterium]